VTSIEVNAFSNCPKLQYYEADDGLYLGNESNKNLIFVGTAKSSVKVLSISGGTKIIADSACRNMTTLTTVSIPSSITHIGKEAFYNCANLSTLNFTGTAELWRNGVNRGANWSAYVPATYIRTVNGNANLNY
jgi:hypothetical protein